MMCRISKRRTCFSLNTDDASQFSMEISMNSFHVPADAYVRHRIFARFERIYIYFLRERGKEDMFFLVTRARVAHKHGVYADTRGRDHGRNGSNSYTSIFAWRLANTRVDAQFDTVRAQKYHTSDTAQMDMPRARTYVWSTRRRTRARVRTTKLSATCMYYLRAQADYVYTRGHVTRRAK